MSASPRQRFMTAIEKEGLRLAAELGVIIVIEVDDRGKYGSVAFRVGTPTPKILKVRKVK